MVLTVFPVANSGVNNSPAPLFNSPQSSQITPNKSKYINPKTGGYFTPEEYANYVAMNLPVGKVLGIFLNMLVIL